jgi:hypothetical protein
MRRLSLFTAVASLLSLTACNSTNPNPSPSGNVIQKVAYSVSANGKSLVVSSNVSYCMGNVLSDSLALDSNAFTLSGNALTIEIPGALQDGGMLRETDVLKRNGSGSGLQGGFWETQSETYQGVGTLDSADRMEESDDSLDDSYDPRQVVFSKDSIYSYGNPQLARSFIAGWNFDGDSAIDSISLSYVSQYVAQLTGLITGEIVTITYAVQNGNAEVTYSSSVSVDSTFHYYANAESCPDATGPAWFDAFVNNNEKPSAYGSLGVRKISALPRRVFQVPRLFHAQTQPSFL